MIFNNIIAISMDVECIKYLHIMIPKDCSIRRLWYFFMHFMNSLSSSIWLNLLNSLQSLQNQFSLDRAVSKSPNKSPEQLHCTYAWCEWHSIFFECCCVLLLHIGVMRFFFGIHKFAPNAATTIEMDWLGCREKREKNMMRLYSRINVMPLSRLKLFMIGMSTRCKFLVLWSSTYYT